MPVEIVSPVPEDFAWGILDLFADEWWTADRTLDEVARLLVGSTATVALVQGD